MIFTGKYPTEEHFGAVAENLVATLRELQVPEELIDEVIQVVLTVKDAPDGVRGDSASNVQKSITMETGLVIQAPLFIKTGEKIRVDVKNRKYLERAGD